jgi:positive regulator of sigma E activity
MTPYRMVALVLLVALLVTAMTPGRAEAMEPATILLIAGAVIVIVIVVAYLYVADRAERRRAADEDGPRVVLVALGPPAAESP